MTPKQAAAEHDDFMAFAGKVLDAAVKLKEVMIKQGLTSAKAKCPMCETGHLHGRLITGPGAGRPKDQYGHMPAIIGDGWSIVWEWPRGGMAWFFWNWGGLYRIGPVTVHRLSFS